MFSPAASTSVPVLSGSASKKAFFFPDILCMLPAVAAALQLPAAVNNEGKNVVSVSQFLKRGQKNFTAEPNGNTKYRCEGM